MGSQLRGGRTAIIAAIAAMALLPAPAAASFHLMKVREVYPAGSASYVELQMYAAGEYLVAGHHLVSYNPNGSVADEFTLPNNVSISSPNNATILIAGSGYAAAFPGKPSSDELDSSMSLSASGGAVCWTDGSPPDCVAWGDFAGPFPAHVPALVAGSPVSPGGVSGGKALRRTIAPNCSTLLEASDDSDASAADFSEQAPNPRDNASPVTETACTAPTATIDSKPANPTGAVSASFTYHSTPAGAEFECKLDAEPSFSACAASGQEYAGPLADGSHSFQVRAKSADGTGTPASYVWTVDTQPPAATIKTHPANPSAGSSASFTYESNELNSTFECSLAREGEADAFSACAATGRTYTSLANGMYTFKVRATDRAGNQGSPVSFAWEVDNSLADTTPPETTIDSKPPDPSNSATASFAYSSNEPGSTFECSFDGSPFAACAAAGATYAGLVEGPHAFQVRAIDPSANVDPTPAGYSFSVVLPPPAIASPPPPGTTPTTRPRRRRCRHLKGKARRRCLRRHHRR